MPNKNQVQGLDLSNLVSKFRDMSKEDKLKITASLVRELKQMHSVSGHEILGNEEPVIPIGIFDNDALSSLEAVVKYMKEGLRLKFFRIARLLNRSSKTVWATYSNSLKKMPQPFGHVSGHIIIPVSTFADRSLSTLENVVSSLKQMDYSNQEIAEMLHLDNRTIWTVCDRIRKKRGTEIEKQA